MSLANDAANDWREIINSDLGASWACTVTSPDAVSAPFLCRMSDTAQKVNPGTEEVVSGHQLVISICTQDLIDAGFGDIRGIERNTEKPWLLDTENINGVAGSYKVNESNPDYSLGNMVLWLEVVK